MSDLTPRTELGPPPSVSNVDEPYQNALLALGMSEHLSECSWLAAGARKIAIERLANEGRATNLTIMSEAPYQSPMHAANVSEPIVLPSGYIVRMALARFDTDTENQSTYLFAVTRDDIAFRIARLGRRSSNMHCDYVQIGSEIDDESLIVTPKDETASRADIIASIYSLVKPQTVSLPIIDPKSTFYERFCDLDDPDAYSSTTRSKRAAMILAAADLQLIEDNTVVQCAREFAEHGRLKSHHIQSLKKVFESTFRSILSDQEYYIPKKIDYIALAYIKMIVDQYTEINTKYTDASNLANLISLDETMVDALGKTSESYEKLLISERLRRYCGKTLLGKHTAIPYRGILTTGHYEIAIESDAQQTYSLRVAATPEGMEDQPMIPLQTIELPKNRPPSSLALSAAEDLLDLLNKASRVKQENE
ncbi:MAG TPA: hypothetical protein VFN56_05060 [Candidatus Saccharimonadales bacterium]|nr:hypothetical protein [Candidatus Saccharimonadales bacterium]